MAKSSRYAVDTARGVCITCVALGCTVLSYCAIDLGVGVGGVCRFPAINLTHDGPTKGWTANETKRPPRDQRYRDKLREQRKKCFLPSKAGMRPLPYVSRELLKHLKGAELKVWILHCSRGVVPIDLLPHLRRHSPWNRPGDQGNDKQGGQSSRKNPTGACFNDRGTRRYLLRDASAMRTALRAQRNHRLMKSK